MIETSSVCFDVFSLFSFILFFHPPSFFYTLGIKQVHGRTSSLRTPAKQLRQADLSNTAPTPCLSLSFCCSNIIRQEGTHFLSLAHMEGNHQYTCTLLAPSFFFHLPLTVSCLLTRPFPLILSCLCEVACASVCAHFQTPPQKKKKVTKFAGALSFPLI